jgi:hypothetical protein
MADKSSPARRATKEPTSDLAVSYNEFKEYEGQRYSGMKIGRSHKWHYDPGDWKETKITPDLWQIGYAVTKRRAGRAPEGPGAERERLHDVADGAQIQDCPQAGG